MRCSLNIRYFNGLIFNFLCCFILDIYNLFNFVVGVVDSSFMDVDLFGMIGELFLFGVFFIKGFYIKFVFNFWFVVNVG